MSEEEIRDRGGIPASITVYPKPIPFGAIRERVTEHLRDL